VANSLGFFCQSAVPVPVPVPVHIVIVIDFEDAASADNVASASAVPSPPLTPNNILDIDTSILKCPL